MLIAITAHRNFFDWDFAVLRTFFFLNQNFWGLNGLDRLLWARLRPLEYKTETKISRSETVTIPRLTKTGLMTGLETRPGLETSVTGCKRVFALHVGPHHGKGFAYASHHAKV